MKIKTQFKEGMILTISATRVGKGTYEISGLLHNGQGANAMTYAKITATDYREMGATPTMEDIHGPVMGDPADFAPYTCKQEWMSEEVWAAYQAEQKKKEEDEIKLAAITKMVNDTAGRRRNLYTGGEHRVKWL